MYLPHKIEDGNKCFPFNVLYRQVKLSKEMEENIKKYNDQIETIEDFVRIVRLRPGMYIGPIGTLGHINMIREILQNSLDEMVKETSPGSWINITYDERVLLTMIEDNGRGIPFESMIRIFADQHTSSNYTKQEGEFSSGLHGVGAKVSNALSKWFEVQSFIFGEGRKVRFEDGKATKEGIVEIPNPGKQGTIVSFEPSIEAMGNITTTVTDVLNLILLILPLTKIGSPIRFKGIYKDGSETNQELINEDGIITNLIMKTPRPLISPIILEKYTGFMTADIAFTYDSEDFKEKDITAFANFCPTSGGTHIQGFTNAVNNFFRNYMNNIFLANNSNKKSKKNSKLSVINNDIETGLKAIVSVKHLNPNFTGQAKENLSNEDMKPFVEEVIKEGLNNWVKENPKDLQRLCNYFKNIAEIRMKSDGEKVKLSNNYKSTAFSKGLPGKYIPPLGSDDVEIIVFEGDSALQSARNARCSKRQGLYPLKGKIPNAFNTTKEKFINNEDIAGMLSIVGGGYGKKFDINKVNCSKFIIGVDADYDGKHIRAGILKFVLMYMTPMLEAGMIYSLVPPLYSIKNGNNTEYLTDRYSYVEYIQKLFMKDNSISTTRGNKLSKKELSKLLLDNIDYTYELERIANTYSLNYELVELVLLNLNDFNNMKRVILNKYRFIKQVTMDNGVIIITGLIDSKYQTMIVNSKFIQECSPIIEYIKSNETMYYNLNGEPATLYTIMKTFEKYSPKSIQRYKGLGEMNSKQLKESCVHPDSDRTLIQYTVESLLEELETIKYLESNKDEFIKNVKVSRLDILG